MVDSRKIQTVSSAVVDPRQWLTAYFHTRAHLASSESEFHCDPACTRPGCKNKNILVPASLVDLLGAAGHHNESVSATYQRYYTLGLFPHEQNDWIKKVSLRLKKPCPFLENDLCSIYPVRPLACIIFPEYLVSEGRFELEAGKKQFKDFLCLQSTLRLSPKRAEIVGRLKKMWERETLISNFFLFNHSHCYIDFSNLTKELLQTEETLRQAGSIEGHEPPGTIPNQVIEHFFLNHSAGCPAFDGISARISSLDNRKDQAQFLQLLQDDALMNKLMRRWDDRDLIFRFVKGKLKTTRRSLLPGEYKFY